MAKAPAFQFYVRDWLSDPQLQMVSHATKGIWIDLLCYLWESPERGILTATPEQFQKLIGCTSLEWDQFMRDATVTKFADVTICNDIVTVKNRRMWRDENNRKNTKIRVRRHREKKECNGGSNADITVPSSSSSSSSCTKVHKREGDKPPKPPRNVFVKPTLQQIIDYCHERGNSVDPQVWMDHYTSNGWKVGKNPMQDWKAAVRTWEGRSGENGNGNGRRSYKQDKPGYDPRAAEVDELAAEANRLFREGQKTSSAPGDT